MYCILDGGTATELVREGHDNIFVSELKFSFIFAMTGQERLCYNILKTKIRFVCQGRQLLNKSMGVDGEIKSVK